MAKDIHICTVLGETTAFLPHFIQHYKNLGINKFHVIIQLKSKKDTFYKQASLALAKEGLEIEHTYIGPWNGRINSSLINSCISKYPDDWFVVSDQDELQLYPDNLGIVIAEQNQINNTFVTGCFIDRISIDGKLNKINAEENIWDQFPRCGYISFPLAGANPYKITLCKGSVCLSEGQHGVVIFQEHYPIVGEVISQVHHFKWDASVIDRLNNRLKKQALGEWENSYAGYGDEVRRILKYLLMNNNNFSITEPLFLLDKGAKAFGEYKYWEEVKLITSTWDQLQKYPKLNLDTI